VHLDEIADLEGAGCSVIQGDEPASHSRVMYNCEFHETPDCGLQNRTWPETIAASKTLVEATDYVRMEITIVQRDPQSSWHSSLQRIAGGSIWHDHAGTRIAGIHKVTGCYLTLGFISVFSNYVL